jgi:hypothetical protein
MERTHQQSSETPTGKSKPPSLSRPINSPEFRKEALDELRDWVEQGHANPAPGNQVMSKPQK